MAAKKQDIPRDSGGYGYTLGTWYDSTIVTVLNMTHLLVGLGVGLILYTVLNHVHHNY